MAARRRIAIVVHDIVVVAAAWFLAYLTRFDFHFSIIAWPSFWYSLPIVVISQSLILWFFGLYRGVWRFASILDLWNIIRTAALGVLMVALLLFIFNRLEGMPRTVLAAYPVFLILLLGSPRLIYRIWREYGLGTLNSAHSKRVLIIGAGRAGEMLARDMRRDELYNPVGFLDDQGALQGTKVHGVPVLGTIDELPVIAHRLRIDLVIIAVPSATAVAMRRLVEICEKSGIPFRTLPRLHDLVSGEPSISEVREVNIEDLLGREPVLLDWRSIGEGIMGQIVLVTGAGGSIGSELCRQIVRLKPAALVLFENNECNLFHIEGELRARYHEAVLHAFLGDVRDRAAVFKAFGKYKPDIVFHAAAYKHVPMLEFNEREAVRNNVRGTRIIAQAADRFGCSTFVMISSDKAVNPSNVMGATKRVAELYCQSLNRRSRTRFIIVRFGNVLASAGSVIPLFREQIRRGGPVTVTHPAMTRYFMTIPEAAQLILQSAVIGEGGEIFVLDMGEPISIPYLAEQMIRLSGKVPHRDIDIVFSGLRPGEKLFEELFHDNEERIPTGHDKILLARSNHIDWQALHTDMRALDEAVEVYNEQKIDLLLRRMVPALKAQKVESDNVVPFERVKA